MEALIFVFAVWQCIVRIQIRSKYQKEDLDFVAILRFPNRVFLTVSLFPFNQRSFRPAFLRRLGWFLPNLNEHKLQGRRYVRCGLDGLRRVHPI